MKLCGIDLNGMHDHAARSWSAGAEDERETGEKKNDTECFIVDGGRAGVAVEVGENDRRIVAGPQAAFAPHGRGGGWGPIGETGRRCRIVDALKETEHENGLDEGLGRESIIAAVELFAQGADIAVFTIPDSGHLLERQQSALLGALQETRARRVELVWRPVVLCLGLMNRLTPVLNAKGGEVTVAILSDMRDSLHVTEIELVSRTWRGQEIVAPRRRRHGVEVAWGGCWRARVDEALKAVQAANSGVDPEIIERQSRLPFDMAAGRKASEEIFRDESGRWIKIRPPAVPSNNGYPLPVPTADIIEGADAIILDAPAEARRTSHIKQAARPSVPNDVLLIEARPNTAARGAFEAANRLARHEPPWFDFLPGIAVTVVRKDGRADFQDLIPIGENAVPAGEPYRCQTPPSYSIRRGLEELEIYLEKEDEPQLRRWSAPFVPPPEREVVVTMRLEQRPTQGWARIEMTSDQWSQLRNHPIRLDWSALSFEERSREELIDELNQSPGYPDRIVYRAHVSHWEAGSDWQSSIEEYLRHAGKLDRNHGRLLGELYTFFRTSSPPDGTGGKRFPLDTDGKLPDSLTKEKQEKIEGLLELMLEHLANDLDRHVQSRKVPHGLSCPPSWLFLPATWCFLRCPEQIRKRLIHAIVDDPVSARSPAQKPRLIQNPGGPPAVYHSLARCLMHPSEIETVLNKILQIPIRKFNQNHLACISGLVSRRNATIELLAHYDIWLYTTVEWACEGIGRFIEGKIQHGFYTYALLLCGGLLRVRQIRPAFLTLEEDENAEKMKRLLEMARRRIKKPQLFALRKQTEEMIEYIEGHGTNRNLLMEIDSSAPT